MTQEALFQTKTFQLSYTLNYFTWNHCYIMFKGSVKQMEEKTHRSLHWGSKRFPKDFQKQPSIGFLRKKFIEITLQHGCSPVNLLHIFRTHFYKNTYEGLLLDFMAVFQTRSLTRTFRKFKAATKLFLIIKTIMLNF